MFLTISGTSTRFLIARCSGPAIIIATTGMTTHQNIYVERSFCHRIRCDGIYSWLSSWLEHGLDLPLARLLHSPLQSLCRATSFGQDCWSVCFWVMALWSSRSVDEAIIAGSRAQWMKQPIVHQDATGLPLWGSDLWRLAGVLLPRISRWAASSFNHGVAVSGSETIRQNDWSLKETIGEAWGRQSNQKNTVILDSYG